MSHDIVYSAISRHETHTRPRQVKLGWLALTGHTRRGAALPAGEKDVEYPCPCGAASLRG